MDIALLAAPQWYIDARREGAPKESLRPQVAAFCLKALERRAAKENASPPTHVPPELIDLTLDMYEYALHTVSA